MFLKKTNQIFSLPGFIDLQLNGGFGYDFTTEPESIEAVAKLLPRYGVTSFLPTIVSSTIDTYEKALKVFEKIKLKKPDKAARVLGWHFEGPFFNPNRIGAHQKEKVSKINLKLIKKWSRSKGVAMVTLAPELKNAAEAISILKANGIIVSLGHSEASFEIASAAFKNGVSLATHLFNGMPPICGRAPGPVLAALFSKNTKIGFICDGVHLHEANIKLLAKIAGRRLMLVSDALAGMGAKSKSFFLGDQKVFVQKGSSAAVLKNGKLAGSVLPYNLAVKKFFELISPTLEQLKLITSLNQASLLGIKKTIVGDKVILGADFSPLAVYVDGKLTYKT
ncbi:MAG TPA: N-acetylglucosamine-6-phosphate deacetylase [Oligoflexia bacterium]|nr:N-acetylglucosamine-6-phosphate deacetylase [Oligoflexia bacterium]HMP26911.1 N-acetylglucosamine-6-phosphate deacetylase [Oligoflexia bacterium]